MKTSEDILMNSGIKEVRCHKCNRLLGNISGYYDIKCPRCKELNRHLMDIARKDLTKEEDKGIVFNRM